jgi:hypothetical protein
MSSSFTLFMRTVQLCIIALLPITRAASASPTNVSCTPSATQTIELKSTHREPTLQQKGYRTTSVRWDPLLGQQWATIASCDHPERPSIALLMSSPRATTEEVSPTPFPIVHAGDLVRLWKQENDLRIEASGIAAESGATGRRIRVRLLRSDLDGQLQEQALFGIVRGKGDVEIQR